MDSFFNSNKNKRNNAFDIFLFLAISLFLSNDISAQRWGYVIFKDKGIHSNDYQQHFSIEAQNRRAMQNIPWDERDAPVNEAYISTIENYSDTTFGASRWLNALIIGASENSWKKIAELPFVREIEFLSEQPIVQAEFQFTKTDTSKTSNYETREAQNQTALLEPKIFQEHLLNGKNIVIAVLDAGFSETNKVEHLSHLFSNNQIIATKDFLKKTEDVFSHSVHGTEVLTYLAGKTDSVLYGLAPEATYALARVTPNMGFFRFLNDVQWIEALEWADEIGASLVNSSLSFTSQLYERNNLNGRSCKISIAANTAMDKGILVINAAGNELQSDWEIIGAPGDAERILTVGSVDPKNGYVSNFSSVGPTADGRLKPDICAPGELLYPDGSKFKHIQGTSFATPLVCGFAACVKQLHPEWTAEKLWTEIRKSGSLYPYFDYAHGFGIPQASYFFSQEKEKPNVYSVHFRANENDTIPSENTDQLILERLDGKEIDETYKGPVAFIQFVKSSGEVFKYTVSRPLSNVISSIKASDYVGCKLRIVYDRHFFEIPIPQR